ncbi:MAG: hypothetical protein EP343_19545 [Deltaproteobacteria bacterium]|nr:MAG: hypothetical protein EP343_19545 [Deltaproteobacteria bacterium]
MQKYQLDITDWEQFNAIRGRVFGGSAFVFVTPEKDPKKNPQENEPLLQPGTYPAFGVSPFVLPGVTVKPEPLPTFSQTVLVCDKALYQENKDSVHVFVWQPDQKEETITLTVTRHSETVQKREVQLDSNGAGTLTLSRLTAGDYKIIHDVDGLGIHSTSADATCSFAVATYRLAPLTASLTSSALHPQGDGMDVTLSLQSFGTPTQGNVRVQVREGEYGPSTALEALATDGLIEISLKTKNKETLFLDLQLVDNSTHTATVPLLGSSQDERTPTTLSTLGQNVTGTLTPQTNATPVRGIYLSQSGNQNTPFAVERIDTQRIKFTARESCTHVILLQLAPKDRRDAETSLTLGGVVQQGDLAPMESLEILQLDAMEPGDTLEMNVVADPATLFLLGAFVKETPWEGWSFALPPSPFQPTLQAPEQASPGESITLTVENLASTTETSVYMVVKDARLGSNESPALQVAGQLKTWIQETSSELEVGHVQEQLKQPVYALRGGFDDGMLYSASFGGESTTMDMMAMEIGPASGSYGEAPPPSEGTAASNNLYQAPPDVLFAGLIPVEDGLAQLTLPLPDVFATYTVNVFAISQENWADLHAEVKAEKETYASLELPVFVHPGDQVWGRIHCGAGSGSLEVYVLCDGKPVTLHHKDQSAPHSMKLDAQQVTLRFPADVGEYQAFVTDTATGHTETVYGEVQTIGTLVTEHRTLRFLQSGERISQRDEQDILSLRLLPGLEQPFKLLLDATSDYTHMCCEQTAGKMLAAIAMYTFADDQETRDKAESIVLTGTERMETMWLKGRGFRMYPNSPPEPNAYWGPLASNYLRYVALLQEIEPDGCSPALMEAVEACLVMAKDTAKGYKQTWPPEKARTPEQAYAMFRFGQDEATQQRALQWADQQARKLLDTKPMSTSLMPWMSGAVGFRTQDAYLAATLFAGGQDEHRDSALRLTNRVVDALDENGRLYSTTDSVAAIALFLALNKLGLLDRPGHVRLDQQSLSLEEALQSPHQPSEMECSSGLVLVEVVRRHEERWDAFSSDVPLSVHLEQEGKTVQRCAPGETLTLVVELTQGYHDGDLLWVCLPDSLARLSGGGQVKRFSVDFQGESHVRVPLAAVAPTGVDGDELLSHHYAVCVRNMFTQERVGNPGLLRVTVA